jgi:hypothetical protein
MDAFVQAMLQHGVLGLLCAMLLTWSITLDRRARIDAKAAATALESERKRAIADRDAAETKSRTEREALQSELAAEQHARIEDAQRYTKLALDLQDRALEACKTLRDHVTEYKRLADSVESLAGTLRRGGPR